MRNPPPSVEPITWAMGSAAPISMGESLAAAQFWFKKGMTLHEHTTSHMKRRAISCDQVTQELIIFSASILGMNSEL